MANTRSPLQYKGVRAIRPPDLTIADRAPTVTDTAYFPGQIWLDKTAAAAYQYSGTSWITLGSGTTGSINSITGDSGGAETPLAGNFSLLGTANQITVTGASHKETFSLSATLVAPGTLTVIGLTTLAALTQVGTANINASGAAVTTIGTGGTGAVNIGNATGNTAVTGSLTASTGLTATAGGITATGTSNINTSGSAITTIGTGGTGATRIGNATGNTAVTGSLTASTTLTATLGAITATNGNLSLGTAGNKIIIATGSNASVGTSGAMSGTPGAVTVATTASSATAKIFFSRNVTGGTPGQVSITAQDGTGFTLTSTGNETSTFNWWIINA